MTSHYFLIILLFCLASYVAPQGGIRLPEGARWKARSSKCGGSAQCTSVRKCASTLQPNWRQYAIVCGYSKRGQPQICCKLRRRTGKGSRTGEIRNEVSVSIVPSEPRGSSATCGAATYRSLHSPRIMGGQFAREGQFPWMAALLRRRAGASEDFQCTAFVIDYRHVLTAAHCFPRVKPSQYLLRAGDLDYKNGRSYTIKEISIPSGYSHGRFYDDIAVLTLDEPITDPKIKPICLPSAEVANMDLTGLETTVAGWGAERYRGSISNDLKYLSGLPIISNDECDRRLTRLLPGVRKQFNRGVDDGFICAGFEQGGKDSCEGDSGGPLMYWYKGIWYAIGLVSFGYECGQPLFPAGYTKLSTYMGYIQRHTRS